MPPRSPCLAGRHLAAALVSIAFFGGFAQAQVPTDIGSAPLVPAASPTDAPAVKPAGVPSGGCPCASGDEGTQFGVDVLLGQFLGVRGQAAVYRTPDRALVLEGYYGLILDKLASGEGAGGGARYYFHRTDRSGSNSVLIGPGLGAYYHFSDKVWMAAPTLDIAWVHAISENGSFELGLNAGVGVGLSDGRQYYSYYPTNDHTAAGRVTPLFSLFTGFRF